MLGALLANIRLAGECLKAANALAYRKLTKGEVLWRKAPAVHD